MTWVREKPVSVASPKAAPATATRRWMARDIQRNLEDGHSYPSGFGFSVFVLP